MKKVITSIVIPVLDFSSHSEYNISTLLKDLEKVDCEVICIFNSTETYEKLKDHNRIDKYCFNKLNAGVSRSWNMGINLAEGEYCIVMNADLKIYPNAIVELVDYASKLDNAVIVGPQGTHINFKELTVLKYYTKGEFSEPIKTHDISGFLFCINLRRFLENGLAFDTRFTPCFFEEWDMGLQAMSKRLSLYTVPVRDFEHHWGISQSDSQTIIEFLGKRKTKAEIYLDNRKKFIEKWGDLFKSL